MSRNMMSGFIMGGVVGAALGMYTISNMTPRQRRKMMRRRRKMISSASQLLNGFQMF